MLLFSVFWSSVSLFRRCLLVLRDHRSSCTASDTDLWTAGSCFSLVSLVHNHLLLAWGLRSSFFSPEAKLIIYACIFCAAFINSGEFLHRHYNAGKLWCKVFPCMMSIDRCAFVVHFGRLSSPPSLSFTQEERALLAYISWSLEEPKKCLQVCPRNDARVSESRSYYRFG